MATLAQSRVDGVRVLRLGGILNQDGVDLIRPAFTAEAEDLSPLVIDLSAVDIIHTPGIGILLGAHRDRKRAGGQMFISGATAGVAEILSTCKLDRIFKLVPSPADAIDLLRREGDAGPLPERASQDGT